MQVILPDCSTFTLGVGLLKHPVHCSNQETTRATAGVKHPVGRPNVYQLAEELCDMPRGKHYAQRLPIAPGVRHELPVEPPKVVLGRVPVAQALVYALVEELGVVAQRGLTQRGMHLIDHLRIADHRELVEHQVQLRLGRYPCAPQVGIYRIVELLPIRLAYLVAVQHLYAEGLGLYLLQRKEDTRDYQRLILILNAPIAAQILMQSLRLS